MTPKQIEKLAFEITDKYNPKLKKLAREINADINKVLPKPYVTQGIMYKDKDRYQFQPRHIKVSRWLRHKPVSYAKALCLSVIDLMNYRRKNCKNILETIAWKWRIELSKSDIRMGAYYTNEEIKQGFLK